MPTSGVAARHFSVSDGLPSSYISGIVQDETGFLWIATLNGLVRYDGFEFKTFTHHLNDSNSIGRNAITGGLVLDKSGMLFLLFDNGEIDLFNPKLNTAKKLSDKQPFKQFNKRFAAQNFTQETNGTIWLKDVNRGVFKTNIQRQAIEPVGNSNPLFDKVVGVQPWRNGSTYIFTTNKAIILDEQNKILDSFASPYPVLSSDFYPALKMPLESMPNGNLIMGIRNPLVLFNPTAKALSTLYLPEVSGTPVHAFYKDKNNRLYIYCGKNIYRLQVDNSPVLIGGLPADKVTASHCFFVDNNDIIWIGTPGGGLYAINTHLQNIQADSYTNLLNSVFYKYNIPSLPNNNIETNNYILRSCIDSAGKLWVGNGQVNNTSSMPSLAILSDGKWTIPPVITNTAIAAQKTVLQGLSCTQNGDVVGLTSNNEILLFDSLKNGLAVHSYNIGLPTSNIENKYLLAISKQEGWIATDIGLVHYNTQTKSSQILTETDGLPTRNLLFVIPDKNNLQSLWLGSVDAGLIHYNYVKKTSEHFTTKDGLPNNQVHCIATDAQGFIWMSTNNGLAVFNPLNKQVQSFKKNDGLPLDEYNRYHFMQLPAGQLLFAGNEHYVVVKTRDFAFDNSQPTVAITDLLISNEPTDFGNGPSGLPQPINSLLQLALNYEQNILSFKFSALDFSQPTQIKYRCKLDGYDHDWIQLGNQHSSSYTNLQPGRYKFMVNASNTAGVWSSYIKTLTIIISPPWWKTWWAYTLYALLAALAIWSFLQYRIRQIKLRQQVILKEKEATQLKEVNKVKTQFFSNITHEFRTPLTLILSPVEKLLSQQEASPDIQNTLLSVRQNAGRLLQLINQLLDISKLEAGNMALQNDAGDVVVFVQQIVDFFRQYAAQKNITLSFELPNTLFVYFDKDKLEKIVSNLLSNAVKFTPENGNILVEIQGTDELGKLDVLLSVTDTGIGIAPHEIPNVFNRFYQADNSASRAFEGTGIGLALVKELATIMGGNVLVESTLGQGSRFIVRLPLERATAADVKIEPPFGYSAVALSNQHNAGFSVEKELPTNTETVLVVEDNNELRAFVANSLQHRYHILQANNGADGWLLAKQHIPDIIITDWMMPEMLGPQFIQLVKNDISTSHIACILLTAKSAGDSRIEGLTAGADDYLSKPFLMDELLLRIKNQLQRRQALQLYYQQQILVETKTDAGTIAEAELITDLFLQQLYKLIDEFIDSPELNIDLIAEKLAVSRRTLQRKTNALTGFGPQELVRKYRLKKAAILLRKGQNISQAAYATGFGSAAYFSTCFKEEYGTTPSEWLAGQ